MNLNNIDLNKIAVFCQVVDLGSYRAAGEVLNVTPSALSQSISVLEHSLGFALFHRVGKRLVPTENGLHLRREFKVYHDRFNEAIQQMAVQKNEVQGIIRVGAYLEFAKSQLSPAMSRFLRKYPLTQIKFVFETPTRLHQLLEGGFLDLCFSIYPSSQTRLIESKPIFKEELVLVAPKGLFAGKPKYEELMKTPIVEYYQNHQPIRRWLELHYKKKPKNLPVRAFASTAEMVLALVKENAGIGIVPKFILSSSDLQDSIEIIRPTERKFVDHIWMLTRKTSAPRPGLVAFVEHMDSILLKDGK